MTEEKRVSFKQVQTEVERIGFHLIAERPLTTHEGDWFLRVVMADKKMEDGRTEFAVWLFNGTRDTLNEGYYTFNREAASEKFMNKK